MRARIPLGLLWLLVGVLPAAAQTPPVPCDFTGPAATFPRIPLCAFVGGYKDSSLLDPKRCVGAYQGPQPDSVDERARTVTVRFRRDRRAEKRSDFGGYRIYRVTNYSGTQDTSRMILLRRFSRQAGDERTWNFSVVDTSTLEFKCKNSIVTDSVVTFVDPDSSGNFVRVRACVLRDPPDDPNGRCVQEGDSVLVLKTPPGPHDGFRARYAITYEGRNQSSDGNYADLFVPDLTRCTNPSDPSTCANLNDKLLNLSNEVEPTAGPTTNLERVVVVPNPFRASVPWDAPGGHEVHFINLPPVARIRIFTVAGDLVVELNHSDKVRDFERWDLKNQEGQDVASGIYMFRVDASTFNFQDRFIVIR